jgi:hypothetical protein
MNPFSPSFEVSISSFNTSSVSSFIGCSFAQLITQRAKMRRATHAVSKRLQPVWGGMPSGAAGRLRLSADCPHACLASASSYARGNHGPFSNRRALFAVEPLTIEVAIQGAPR